MIIIDIQFKWNLPRKYIEPFLVFNKKIKFKKKKNVYLLDFVCVSVTE